jgi:zinc transport system permease protein
MSVGIFEILSYPPILRGALVLLVSGTIFPLVGVFVLRLNLITLRFALMHSALLGAAVALAIGVSPLLTGIAANLILVLIVSAAGARSEYNAGHVTTFFMVFTIGLAFAILYRFDVPARESLGLLWGNIFALTPTDATITVGFAAVVLVVVVALFPRITAVLYDRETAFTSGIDDRTMHLLILAIVGLTITLVMGLIGALLLDAVLILPALIAGFGCRSTRGLFLRASLWGAAISVTGFLSAIWIDIPVSSGVTLVGALALGAAAIYEKHRKARAAVTAGGGGGVGGAGGPRATGHGPAGHGSRAAGATNR